MDDIILVRPGDRIPADGLITQGESAIDEAPSPAKARPCRRGRRDRLRRHRECGCRPAGAGDRHRGGQHHRRVVRLVEEAPESKAPTGGHRQLLALTKPPPSSSSPRWWPSSRPCSWAEAGTPGSTRASRSCSSAAPARCLSTPAAIAAGLSRAPRRGLLLGIGAVLEGMGKGERRLLRQDRHPHRRKPVVTD